MGCVNEKMYDPKPNIVDKIDCLCIEINWIYTELVCIINLTRYSNIFSHEKVFSMIRKRLKKVNVKSIDLCIYDIRNLSYNPRFSALLNQAINLEMVREFVLLRDVNVNKIRKIRVVLLEMKNINTDMTRDILNA